MLASILHEGSGADLFTACGLDHRLEQPQQCGFYAGGDAHDREQKDHNQAATDVVHDVVHIDNRMSQVEVIVPEFPPGNSGVPNPSAGWRGSLNFLYCWRYQV